MEDQDTRQSAEIPKWLKHLQDNSWEIEILISGGAIFSLFQIADSVAGMGDYLKEVAALSGTNELLIASMIMIRGVTLGFMVHLFLRGLWTALVCLNSVYSNGINFNRIKLTGAYLDQAKKVNLTNQIIRLDRLCGLIFFGSFLFIMIIAGIFLIFAIVGFALDYLFGSTPWFDVILQLLDIILVVYLLDFLSSGLLRKNKYIGKFYYPVYFIINTLSLGFLYRPLLQIISTNINRWKAGFFLLILFGASFLFAYSSLQRTMRLPSIFDQRAYPTVLNENRLGDDLYLDRIPDERRVRTACIQSDFVKDDYLFLFIPYKGRHDLDIEEQHKGAFAEIVTVAMNDSLYQKIDWSGYFRNGSGQQGIVTYLPISNLPKGKNELTIRITGQAFYSDRRDKLVIPFWKE